MNIREIVSASLKRYEEMHVNLDSEYARDAIACAITSDLQDYIKKLKKGESDAHCCEEQAKALRDIQDFFEDTELN